MHFQNSLVFIATAISSVAATTIYANTGCVLVNNQALCNSKNSVQVNNGQAQIYAGFADNNEQQQLAGCGVEIYWPDYYGELFWGADNCPYDANGDAVLNNGATQCCIQGQGQAVVENPYSVYY